MATTYTVTHTFVADTTAVASEVNQNFTDVLTALNAFDASNLSSNSVPLARITGLTTTQFAANVIDTDDTLAADSDTRIASQSATKSYVDAQVATSDWGALISTDTEANGFLVSHAYLVAQNGTVYAYVENTDLSDDTLIGYNGHTDDPEGAGVKMQSVKNASTQGNNGALSINFDVASGRYFEIVAAGGTANINWQPKQTTGGNPVDQD